MSFLYVRDATELERYDFGERCNSHITQVKIVNYEHAVSVNAPPLSQYPALLSRVCTRTQTQRQHTTRRELNRNFIVGCVFGVCIARWYIETAVAHCTDTRRNRIDPRLERRCFFGQ
jgi:hypothetical protein